MSIKERHKGFKYRYPKYVVLIEVGSFYQTFSSDGVILHNIFGYRIINDRVGFPKNSESKVLNVLDSKHINYVLIGDSVICKRFDDNCYDNYSSLDGLSDEDELDFFISKLENLRYSSDLHSSLVKLRGIL